MSGPADYELLRKEFAHNFSTITPAQIPIMLAKFNVPIDTPFKDWLIELNVVVVGVLNMGDFSHRYGKHEGVSCDPGSLGLVVFRRDAQRQVRNHRTSVGYP